MTTEATSRQGSEERAWLLRSLLVLQSPRTVFAALRDDSDEVARARQEPVMALVGLAGIASVLATPVAGRLFDDPEIDALLVAVWAFIGGVLYGFFGYWLVGGSLFLGLRAAGSPGSYLRARHVLAFSLAPVALSLFVVWPLRLAAFGEDVFRTGGRDEGAVAALLAVLTLAFVAWSLALLLVGTKTVTGWPWLRTLEGVALGLALPALVFVGARFLGV